MLTVLVKPALRSAEGDPLLPSDPRKRHTVLEVQPQELEPLKRVSDPALRAVSGGWSAIQEPPRLPQPVPETRVCETFWPCRSSGRPRCFQGVGGGLLQAHRLALSPRRRERIFAEEVA